MIYLFLDGSGYQAFPEPDGSKPYIEAQGSVEQRILDGEPYRLTSPGNQVQFLTQTEILEQRLPVAQLAKRAEVDSWRKAAENAGFSYVFPDGKTGTIQTRDRDMTNIIGLVVAASNAPIGHVFTFRDGEDTSHNLTAAQLVAMGQTAQAFISANYSKAWALKEQIASANSLADLDLVTWG